MVDSVLVALRLAWGRAALLVLLSTALFTMEGESSPNSTYPQSLVYEDPRNSTLDLSENEISLGEEIVLSFLKQFFGPEKVKKPRELSSGRRKKRSTENTAGPSGSKATTYSIVTEVPLSGNGHKGEAEARGKMKDMIMSPYMLIPQLIMLGFSPFILANLKMFVMQTLMMNQMAFSAALWMTIRNMVFGPSGPPVKYYNFGYEKPQHQRRTAVYRRTPAEVDPNKDLEDSEAPYP